MNSGRMEKHQYHLPGLCGHGFDLEQTSMQKSGFRRGICVSLQKHQCYTVIQTLLVLSIAGFHWALGNRLEKLPTQKSMGSTATLHSSSRL